MSNPGEENHPNQQNPQKNEENSPNQPNSHNNEENAPNQQNHQNIEENPPNQQNPKNKEKNPQNQQNTQNNEESFINKDDPQNIEENPPNQQNPQTNEVNSLNQQNPQNNDDEITSRPRWRARATGTLGRGYRTLTRPPMQISWQNVALGPAPPAPRQIRPRAPPPVPLRPPVTLNWEWRCPVCRGGFLNMRSLCGHMRVHKDRNWKGIHPPPELCKPQGLGTIKDLYSKKNYNPIKENDRVLPSLLGVGGPLSVGGELGMSQQIVPWVPMHNSNYQGATGTGGEGSTLGVVNMGKRPAVLEKERPEMLRKTRRTRVGEVPDLNVSPPQDDEPKTEVKTGEGSGAPNADTEPEQEGRKRNSAQHAEPEPEHEGKEGINVADDKPKHVEEGIEGSNGACDEPEHEQEAIEEIAKAVHDEPEPEQEGIEGSNAPHAEPEPELEGRKGDDAPNDEPEHEDKGKARSNAPHDGTETKEERIEGSNAQRDEPEGEKLERGTVAEGETKTGGEGDAE